MMTYGGMVGNTYAHYYTPANGGTLLLQVPVLEDGVEK